MAISLLTYLFFCFFILICSSSVAQIQKVRFNLVEGVNGVTVGKITGITQDPQGYMWFADQTQTCITRFDGYRMTSFRNDPSNPNSLGGTYPECILADSSGVIWVGFYGMGLDRFDPETNTFTHYRHQPDDPNSLSNDSVTAILIDHKGIVWIGNYGGLDRLDPGTGKFTHYRYDANDETSLSHNRIRSLYEDREGTLWVGTGVPFDIGQPKAGGLNRFNRETGTFTRYLHDPNDSSSLINNKVRAIFEDSRGTFWVGTAGDGLHTMDRAKGTFSRHTYDPAKPDQLSRPPKGSYFDHITFISEDGTGAIWVGTFEKGIVRYDPITRKSTHYHSKANGERSFTDDSGWISHTSRDGVLWVSTQLNNLYRINPSQKEIPHVDMGTGISSFLEEAPGILWMGSEQGLIHYNRKTKAIKTLRIDTLNPTDLVSNWVSHLYRDRSGHFWISTYNGLSRFDPKTETFFRYQHDPNNLESISPGPIRTLTEDREGRYWVATQRGLDMMDPTTGLFKHFRHDPDDPSSLSNNFVTGIWEDIAGNLWVGTWFGGGLNLMDRSTGNFRNHLRGANITCIYEDKDSTLWVGTEIGLYRKSPHAANFTPYIGPTGEMGTANVVSIVEDNNWNLWIATYSGLFKLNPKRNEVSVYGKRYGVNANTLSYLSGYKTGQGELLFGNGKGFYAFFPHQVTHNSKPPDILITNFKISDQLVEPAAGGPFDKPLAQSARIELKHNQDVFSFSFVGIHYSNPEENRHFYMLEGYDKAWREANTEKTAYYFDVPAGAYLLRVKAVSSDGLWAEKTLKLTISPPWWHTWWAYGLYAILFIGSLWGFIHYRSRQLRIEKRLLEHRVLLRTAEILRQKEEIEAQRDHLENTLTTLKATQAQLIQSEKMASLGELTAGVAHEIQNPLNFVNNFAEVNNDLIAELKGELAAGHMPEAISMADFIQENEKKIRMHGKRADAIVKGMLQHARTSSGERQPTDLNALAKEYLNLSYAGQRAQNKGFAAKLIMDFDPRLGKVEVVPQQISRVLLNLFNNAFYAVQQKQNELAWYEPKVRVSTGRQNGRAFIKVWDNGTGIPLKIRDKIFQPFFTTKPTGQGTGLGLSLSYDIIIKEHGGQVSVASEEGDWTEFTIFLPYAPVAAVSPSIPEDAPPANTLS